MLDFVVLGQIPGTQVHVTFQWVIIVALVLSLVGSLRLLQETHHRQLIQSTTTFLGLNLLHVKKPSNKQLLSLARG